MLPWGPLWDLGGKIPSFYRRFVDDTLSKIPSIEATILNDLHPSITFMIELPNNGKFRLLAWT